MIDDEVYYGDSGSYGDEGECDRIRNNESSDLFSYGGTESGTTSQESAGYGGYEAHPQVDDDDDGCHVPGPRKRIDVYEYQSEDPLSAESGEHGVFKYERPQPSEEVESGEIREGLSNIAEENSEECEDDYGAQPFNVYSSSPRASVNETGTEIKAQRLSDLMPFTFQSPAANWQTVFEKYSPSTETWHSPVKQSEANLYPKQSPDTHLYGQIWVLSMSEQFHYDNSIILLKTYKDNFIQLKSVLRFNSQITDTNLLAEAMVDVNILGSGTFGDVYRVRKSGTNEYYAIKYLKNTPGNTLFEHTNSLVEYIKEKTFLINSRNSPYVVQFFSSLKFPKYAGLFLIFEWCLTDLRKYVHLVSVRNDIFNITRDLYLGTEDALDQVYRSVYNAAPIELFNTTLVYIFEVFCIIDYLARCNIVHQDLKPENIMIGRNLHLKVGDFGLAYNTKFITRPSQVHLVEASKINALESSNYEARFGGTPLYEDMELCFRSLQFQDYRSYNKILKHPDRMKESLPVDPRGADPDFLSDLWACGLIATELMLGGVNFLDPSYISQEIRSAMHVSDNFRLAVLEITYTKKNYQRYVVDGLNQFASTDFPSLMRFLTTIFQPRRKRAEGFLKERTLYRYKHLVSLKHIDITKVEELDTFDMLGLKSYNAFLFNLPQELAMFLTPRMVPQFNNLRELLENKVRTTGTHFFNLEPGIKTTII